MIIPALNEESSLPLVLGALNRLAGAPLGTAAGGRRVEMGEILVVDNGSTDRTAEVASRAGARVVSEPRRGYGRACLAGIARVAPLGPFAPLGDAPPEIVVFLDADFSDEPDRLARLVMPIADGRADFVLGSRLQGECEPGALLPQARYGNTLAVTLIRLLYGFRYTDLGPFRAIRVADLLALGMRDETFGWTVEMQVKAVAAGLRIVEVSVPYRKRVGSSKITGTVSGTVRAGMKILWTILRLRLRPGGGVIRDRERFSDR
ncbi:MAG TPA: glycosyltransferase family 2 protein [Candidatus Polarisedimenticolia bacterium]|nr:glycosyltransferase family 2 protein [Candidatus Polarisedimenticolia bacterium]